MGTGRIKRTIVLDVETDRFVRQVYARQVEEHDPQASRRSPDYSSALNWIIREQMTWGDRPAKGATAKR